VARCGQLQDARRASYHGGMPVDLYAGIPVRDYAAALAWYERLLGSPPTFVASDTEAVWELAEHRSLAVEHLPEHAGHAMHTIFVDDFDALLAQIAGRGIEPTKRETYSNGVRKAIYCDPDGNEIGFGGAPR
jgi:predicted enzyme related to lactoylglutathione lyase